jgi:hypothetical protein
MHQATQWAPVTTPQDSTLGCASLNLCLPTADACADLSARMHQVLSQILPQVQYHDVTEASLLADDTSLAAPCKRNGRLSPTPLQLTQGSTLILNVGSLTADQLRTPEQLQRLQALQQLTSSHKMPYTFDGGVQIAFEADVRVIVVSTPASSKVLPCLLQVQCEYTDGGTMEMDGEDLSYLTHVRHALAAARGGSSLSTTSSSSAATLTHKNIGLSRDVLDKAQKDFVVRRDQARQGDHLVMPNDADFHRWLTLTRLHARSRRAACAELEDWERALQLDDAMLATL